MITFPCPSCAKPLSVKDELAGKSGPCPHCKQPVRVPEKRKTGAPPLAAAQTSPNVESDDTPSSADVGNEKLDFLAPAKSPGELGRLGPYRILKVLGAGGMGLVLQAEDPALKRLVALKVMRPELAANEVQRKRFIREAQATAAIEHPYIVPIHQVGQDRGIPFIAMPLLKGESLDARLKREGRLPVADCVRIGRQTAEGLAAAHEQGLIHRDIKPGNLWLDKSGWVKILDFGLARMREGEDLHLTKSGTILGTPAYMAPEQAMSKPVDARCDLFSLGSVLYRALTGQLPFQGVDTMSLLMALGTETPRPVRALNPQVPKALSDLVMQLLEKPPEKRPASAKVVAQRLAELEEDRTVAEPRRSFPSLRCGAEGSGKSGRSLPGLAAKLLTMICGLAWRLVRRPGRTGLVIQDAAAALVLLVVLLLLIRPGSEESGDSGRVDDKYITNSIGMKLAYIPAGKFLMGSTADEIERLRTEPHRWEPPGWAKNEGPQHEVRITKPFYMGVHEVTVGQFRQFVKETRYQTEAEKSGGAHRHFPDGSWKQDPAGNWLNPGFDQTDDHPVVCVSWNDAREFCDWLTRKEAGGAALAPEEPIASRPRRSGNIPAVPAQQPAIFAVTTSKPCGISPTWPTNPSSRNGPSLTRMGKKPGTTAMPSPHPWGGSSPMPLVCTTCTGMSGNGAWMARGPTPRGERAG